MLIYVRGYAYLWDDLLHCLHMLDGVDLLHALHRLHDLGHRFHMLKALYMLYLLLQCAYYSVVSCVCMLEESSGLHRLTGESTAQFARGAYIRCDKRVHEEKTNVSHGRKGVCQQKLTSIHAYNCTRLFRTRSKSHKDLTTEGSILVSSTYEASSEIQ
jgi:hypothetical protein